MNSSLALQWQYHLFVKNTTQMLTKREFIHCVYGDVEDIESNN